MFLRASAITALITGALALMAAPAFAAKGGGGNSSSTTSNSSITIASVNGTTTNSSTSSAATTSPAPRLGDSVAFATNAASMAGPEYAMVAVSCYQDVNGDGSVDTTLMGPDLVFTSLDKPSAEFKIGGYSSIWMDRGGDATCRADLYAYSWKGGKEATRILATTGHWNAAA